MSDALDKQTLRRAMKELLSGVDAADRQAWSALLCERVVATDAYERAETVLAYWPIACEPDVRAIWEHAISTGRRVALPASSWDDGSMTARLWDGLAESLVETRHGIFEPDRACESIQSVDLVLVPGLAFDEAGRRLGRGAGFYDRFLAGVRGETMGIAFEAQIVERIPIEPHDVRVHSVATERRMIAAGGSSPHGTEDHR